MIRRIGALHITGYRSKYPTQAELGEAHFARARGFKCIVEDAVDRLLDRVYKGYISSTQDPIPSLTRMYGWFYPWFLYNGGARLSPELGEIIFRNASTKIQVTRRAFSSLIRAGAGAEVRPVTLSEAAAMAKVRQGTIRKFLVAEGIISSQKRRGRPVLVPRDVAERIARDLNEVLTFTSLGQKLHLSRPALTKLVHSDLIPTWRIGGVPGQHTYLFRGSEVHKWIEDMIGAAPIVHDIPNGTVRLALAPSRSLVASVLVRAILAGDLKVIAVLGSKRNFFTALVRLDDVMTYKARIGVRRASDPLKGYRR